MAVSSNPEGNVLSNPDDDQREVPKLHVTSIWLSSNHAMPKFLGTSVLIDDMHFFFLFQFLWVQQSQKHFIDGMQVMLNDRYANDVLHAEGDRDQWRLTLAGWDATSTAGTHRRALGEFIPTGAAYGYGYLFIPIPTHSCQIERCSTYSVVWLCNNLVIICSTCLKMSIWRIVMRLNQILGIIFNQELFFSKDHFQSGI